MADLVDYPENEKLSAVSKEFHAVMDFFTVMTYDGYSIGRWTKEAGFVPVDKKPETLFYEMYDIDPVKLEEERRQMLDALREVL